MHRKKAQISIEYLIIISFVTFVIIVILGIAIYYSASVKDSIKFSQLEKFANKLTKSAENVFYAGTPSKTTIIAYLPEGVKSVSLSGKDVTFEISTNSGTSKISYTSNVILEGSITPQSGVKKISVVAQKDKVVINQE